MRPDESGSAETTSAEDGQPTHLERTEYLLPAPAFALAALIDVSPPDLGVGEPLPMAWQWIYLLERPATADLGPDGHPARHAIPAPPGPGRRRMWAGGRIVMGAGLRLDRPATRHTSISSSIDKQGRSGSMTFVTVVHRYTQDGVVAVSEEQDIVYRDEVSAVGPAPTVTASPMPADVPVREGDWALATPPPLLFRFSALTYNAHRIHYDRDYARDVEGYPGLVVHGPLQAIMMSEAARRVRGPARPGDRFDYRLVSPAFDHDGIVVSARPTDDPDAPARALDTLVRARDGRTTAAGRYLPAS